MSIIDINDKRSSKEFKGITFSKFQKTKVKNELITCLTCSKVESACYWSAELICAGHFFDLWETIILFISRYIHLGNPRLPIYIALRFDNFKTILSNGYIDNELRLRNNEKIRQLFSEIICVLCYSHKKHTFVPVKIKKQEEFDMTNIASKLKAPTINYAQKIFLKTDPKELFIAINELGYHISKESKNAVNACYWLEWLLEYQILCKKRREKCECERRSFIPVQDKYQMDPIWLIWDTILNECKARKNKAIDKIINALLTIFCIKYTSGVTKRRRFLIYFSISLLTEIVDFTNEIISSKNKDAINNILKKIDTVYRDIKKNEEAPNTDYLTNGVVGKSNLDKTIERLEKMNGL
tara:strand:+ start:3211 stop:4272 length:1062 start_codon:yes stop_codon:yes gene_type:complete